MAYAGVRHFDDHNRKAALGAAIATTYRYSIRATRRAHRILTRGGEEHDRKWLRFFKFTYFPPPSRETLNMRHPLPTPCEILNPVYFRATRRNRRHSW